MFDGSQDLWNKGADPAENYIARQSLNMHYVTSRPGVGVTKLISSVLLFSTFFTIAKTYCWISR